MSSSGRMATQNVVKKEGHSDARHSMEGPGGHDAVSMKPVAKEQLPCDFTYPAP